MKISAALDNSDGELRISVQTNENARSLDIPPKPGGQGVSANGGELLFLALAACYCNDIYREAGKRGIEVTAVEVAVLGEFGGPGEPGRDITYRAKVTGKATEAELRALMEHTDAVAEIHNTLRAGTAVRLVEPEVVAI